MDVPENFTALKTQVLTRLSIMEPDGVALLMDQSLGSLPDLGWGAISAVEPIKPEVFETTVADSTVEYVPAALLSGSCPLCEKTQILIGMTRQRRWFGLRERLADAIHCATCGAFSPLQSGVAVMVVYYARGLNQMEWLGREVDVREYMEGHGRPLQEVFLTAP